MGHRISEYEARLQLVTRYVEDARREAEEIRGWIAQLPKVAGQARTLAHDTIDEKERVMEAYLQQCYYLDEELKKCRTGGEKGLQG